MIKFYKILLFDIARGNTAQQAHGAKLLKTLEDRPVLVELIKTVTPQLGKVLQGKADYNTLSKSEKQIFRLYENIDDTSLKALIDYYAYMETPIVTKRQESEISDEPHPSDIAAIVREEDQGAVGGIESPPAYQVGGFQNEFKKGENRQYDELIKSIKSRKTNDAIGIQWKNNEFILGDEKVYFDNNNNIKIRKS